MKCAKPMTAHDSWVASWETPPALPDPPGLSRYYLQQERDADRDRARHNNVSRLRNESRIRAVSSSLIAVQVSGTGSSTASLRGRMNTVSRGWRCMISTQHHSLAFIYGLDGGVTCMVMGRGRCGTWATQSKRSKEVRRVVALARKVDSPLHFGVGVGGGVVDRTGTAGKARAAYDVSRRSGRPFDSAGVSALDRHGAPEARRSPQAAWPMGRRHDSASAGARGLSGDRRSGRVGRGGWQNWREAVCTGDSMKKDCAWWTRRSS